MKTDVPMHITLKKDYFPFKTLSARRVALRYEDKAAKTINELIEKKVITRVKETTEWCSPAFFVPKGDKIRVRLVTDYTELNKHVMRPVHLFSHTREILQAVPNHAKHFAALDAVHGYFQLGLDQESSYITTFLLPQGEVQISQSPHGSKRLIRRMVLSIRHHNRRSAMGKKDRGRHNHLGRQRERSGRTSTTSPCLLYTSPSPRDS